jgi:prevent-host-death family protein
MNQPIVSQMVADTYNIHEAKAQFSKLIRQVEEGHEIVIARDGTIVARIVPERRPTVIQLGRDAGKGRIAPDFDAPLDDFANYTGT